MLCTFKDSGTHLFGKKNKKIQSKDTGRCLLEKETCSFLQSVDTVYLREILNFPF